jgi:hypothetical protein
MPRLVSGDNRLSYDDRRAFRDALFDAFSTQAALTDFLTYRWGATLEEVSSRIKTVPENITDLITFVEDRSETAELLVAARASRPADTKLLELAQHFSLAVAAPSGPELQQTIDETNSLLDPVTWGRSLGQIEGRVCRIERRTLPKAKALGTGFLVGPDVVATNYHVVRRLLEGGDQPAKFLVRFDYKVLADGMSVNPGAEYELAKDWNLASSPFSSLDTTAQPHADPEPGELDYAFLRIEGSPGTKPIPAGQGAEDSSELRGWIDATDTNHDFVDRSPLFILQHPEGGPLKLALNTDAAIGVNGNGTRVRYRTNTKRGSSGSPCFDQNWRLVALHHSGDPMYRPEFPANSWNEGIPFNTIQKHLKGSGREALLSAAP